MSERGEAAAVVRVRVFASLRETVGRSALEVPFREGLTAADVWDRLRAEHPGLDLATASVSVAVNHRFAERSVVLRPGDELAFLPPVSGG